MTYNISFTSVVKDAVTGQTVGGLASYIGTVKEAVVGDGVGYAGPAGIPNLVKEAVTGETIGGLAAYPSTSKEVVTGERFGMDLFPDFISVVIEVVGRDASYKFSSSVKEVVISAPDDQVVIQRQVRVMRELVTQHAVRLAPVDMWSYTPVYQFRQLVTQRRTVVPPISMHNVRQHAQLVLQASPGPLPISVMRAGTLRQLVVQSRGVPYMPISGVFVSTDRQLVTQRRVKLPPVNVISTLQVKSHAQLTVVSRRTPTQDVKQFAQLVIHARNVTFVAPTRVAHESQLVVQGRDTEIAQRSPIEVATDVELVVQQVDVPAEQRSITEVRTDAELVVQERVPSEFIGLIEVPQYAQLTVQNRVPIIYEVDAFVAQQAELVVQQFTPGPLPYTGEDVQQHTQLVVQRRDTDPPGAVSSWMVQQDAQLVVQFRDTVMTRGMVEVKTQAVMYTQAMHYPPPSEAVDPATGRHVRRQRQLVVQHRVTEPPFIVSSASRFVYQVGQQPVAVDEFESPYLAHSDVDASNVLQAVAMGDADLPDPRVPISNVDVGSLTQRVVLGDTTLPDPAIPQSLLDVVALQVPVVVGDATLPDPAIPQSEASVFTAAQLAVLGDVDLPDPTLPASDVQTLLVGLIPALGDAAAFPDPSAPISPLDVYQLSQAYVVPDVTLRSVPARTNRRRAILVVTIS